VDVDVDVDVNQQRGDEQEISGDGNLDCSK